MTAFTLPHYQVLTKIGEGAMSEVYKAKSKDGQLVALKVLRPFLKDNKKYVSRIKLEAQNLGLLKDERIVGLIDIATTDDGRIALVQQLVEGLNLDELIKRDKDRPRPVLGAVIVSEILLGLEEAHRQGVIHRDLKPENIMVSQDGRVKITDFGVAKNLECEELTMTGMVLGSPAYMSPEQADGSSVDQRSDFFSLGTLLYRYATGELPFRGESYSSLSKAILAADPKSVDRINAKVHPELQKIIGKALSKDKEKRYQKAYEFRFELMRYLDLIGAPSPKKVLSAYIAQDSFIEALGEERLLGTLIFRAEKALDKGEKQTGIHLLRQALTLDPAHQKARTLLFKLSRPWHYRWRPVALGLLLLFIAVATWQLRPKKRTHRPLVYQPQVEPQYLYFPYEFPKPKAEKIIVQKVSTKKAALKRPKLRKRAPTTVKKPVPVPLKAPEGKLDLRVDDDILVFINGKKFTHTNKGAVSMPAGLHLIELIKPGFAPIKSSIKVTEGKTTVINSRSSK